MRLLLDLVVALVISFFVGAMVLFFFNDSLVARTVGLTVFFLILLVMTIATIKKIYTKDF